MLHKPSDRKRFSIIWNLTRAYQNDKCSLNFYEHATRQHRRNEWAQWRADEAPYPAAPQRINSGRVALIIAQEAAEPFVTFDSGVGARLRFLQK